MKSIRLKISGFILILALLLSACAPSVIRQTATPSLPAVDPKTNVSMGRRTTRLYFRAADEAFISSELRQIEVKADETVEEAVVRGLLDGPDTALTQLTPLIPEGTKIASLELSGGILFLTLSGEFLGTAMLMPGGWESDMALREAAKLEKQLTIASIVNTLTELGSCDRVKVLVEKGVNASNIPAEILSLFSDADPLPYSGEWVLTPARALETVLHSVMQRDWARISRLVTSAQQLTEARLSADLTVPGLLVDYYVGEDSTASDGSTSTVSASVTIKGADGVERTHESIPVRAARIQEVFRIEYDSLLRLLGAAGED